MKRHFLILTGILFCLSVVIPVYAQDAPGNENSTDRKIDRRTGRETDRKAARRDSLRGDGSDQSERETDRKINRRTNRQGERKADRRDDVRGSETSTSSENAAGTTEAGGTAGSTLFNENSQQQGDDSGALQ
ncbi:hypothetical protein JW948_15990 [bacterium]|nr:hypothetical protein [bacterium]